MKKLILSIIILFSVALTSTAQIQGYSLGQTVSDFTVTDIHGQTHNLYSYTSQGQYVMLDFFFTTCGPCQQTVPFFSELHEKYGCNSGDIVCISMNTGQDNNAAVIAFENTYGGSFAHAPAISGDGGAGAVDNVFNPAAYPTYCLIAPDNTLNNSDIWPISSVSSFENAFPAGSNITPQTCASNVAAITNDMDIRMYPNPANDKTRLLFTTTCHGKATITIYNLLGKIITVKHISNINAEVNGYDISTTNLEAGNYTVSFVLDGLSPITTKLVVVK